MLTLSACASSKVEDLGSKQNRDGTVTDYRGVTYAPENAPVQLRIEARTFSVDGAGYKQIGNTETTATGGNSLGHDVVKAAVGGLVGGAALGLTMPGANTNVQGGTATSKACQSQATSGTAGNNNC